MSVAFPLEGESLPLDHGYHLFCALSDRIPDLHGKNDWGVHPVRGIATERRLELTQDSHVKFLVPVSALPNLLVLVGATLQVADARVQVGPPTVYPLRPSPTLKARIVTIRQTGEPTVTRESFQEAFWTQLGEIVSHRDRVRVEIGTQRVLRIKNCPVPGFAVVLSDLDAASSLEIQRRGIGGRRHMGAGLFVPPGRPK